MLWLAKKHRKGGFMLLEVILSVIIISSAALFIIRSYSTSLRAADLAHRLTKACLLLDEKLATVDMQGSIEEGESLGSFEGEEYYDWSISSSPLDATETPKINAVYAEVTYQKGTQKRSVDVATYVKDREE